MADRFIFSEYVVSPCRTEVQLHYQTEHQGMVYPFCERYTFPSRLPENASVDALLRFLHLAAGTSYYKLFIPGCIQHPYQISDEESSFWDSVYQHGFREFIYTNRLDADRVAVFPKRGFNDIPPATHQDSSNQSVLLGIGGGKDSVVAGELLKSLGYPVEGFVVTNSNVPPQVEGVADQMGVNLLVIEREIDGRLRELTGRSDAFNGHVPVSAIFAIIGCLVAVSRGHGFITVGNESSASIPNTRWKSLEINHQWSKSLHFEKLLQERLETLGSQASYFSPIRPLNAVSVAAMFSKLDGYFHVFTSDSSGFRLDLKTRPMSRWSLGSAKSLSSYILLLPWVEEQELWSVFERDFLDESSLSSMMSRLLGASSKLALECVGTPSELRLSIEAALAQGKCKNSQLVHIALDKGLVSRREGALDRLTEQLAPSEIHAFPPRLTDDLLRGLKESLDDSRRRISTDSLECAGALA